MSDTAPRFISFTDVAQHYPFPYIYGSIHEKKVIPSPVPIVWTFARILDRSRIYTQ